MAETIADKAYVNTGVDVIGTSVTALVLLFLGGVLVLLGTRRRWDKR
jgi:uncharacterized membrane protein